MDEQRRLERELRDVNIQINFFEYLKYQILQKIDKKVQDKLGTLHKRKAELRSNFLFLFL